MAIYNTKYILTYCNKNRIPLRIEIQQRDYTGESFVLVNNQEYLQDNEGNYIVVKRDAYDPNRDVSKVSGSSNPFSLEYRNDKEGKLCTIMATSANLSFWADDQFNIDELKTSDETELKINFYLDDTLQWTGFVVPDFFTEEIGTISEINLTASDRIAILKDIDYNVDESVATDVNFMSIIHNCLLNTGLELGYEIILDVVCSEWSGTSVSGNPLSRTFVNERRFIESNKVKSCYDVLQSILTTFNCRLQQRLGKWVIINKNQLEQANGTVISLDKSLNFLNRSQWNQQNIYFSSILTGGQRTIIPVGSLTTYSLELGDNVIYPFNNTLQKSSIILSSPDGWAKEGTGVFQSENTMLMPFEYNQLGNIIYTYQDSNNWLLINSSYKRIEFFDGFNNVKGIKRWWQHLNSREFKVASKDGRKLDADITISAIGKPNTYINVMITLKFTNIPDKLWSLKDNGKFQSIPLLDTDQDGNLANMLQLKFDNTYEVDTIAVGQEFKLNISEAFTTTELVNYDFRNAIMQVRVYPNTHDSNTANFNARNVVKQIKVDFKLTDEIPKSTTYQAELQGGTFTKQYETQEVMFGDYQSLGQNGYFYQYRDDSLSIMYAADGTKTKNWTTLNDSTLNPLLVHSTRQLAKSFGRANDELNITFDSDYLDPIGNYEITCKDGIINGNFILSGGTIDYMRCECSVILSEKQTKDIEVIDYIYSNF